MVLGICGLIVIYLLYVLLVQGALWKIILVAFGWAGMYWWLLTMPECHAHPFNNDSFSWASVIPTIVVLLALAYTKEE